MSKKNETRCPHCNAKMVKYRHILNKGLAICLIRLAQAGGQAKLNELELSYTQRNNFQKLQYFGLTKKNQDNRHVWILTPIAVSWLQEGIWIKSVVWTYRGAVVDNPPGERIQTVCVNDIGGLPAGWRQSFQYGDEAKQALQGELY